MRQFWIKNAKGQIFDMNREDAFFSDPKGLGISRKTTYEQVGYSWKEKESALSQKKPYGNMIFDGYEQYDEFLKIIQYTPLVLMYQPLDTTYFMDVNTFTIEKSDINYKDTFLTCKVVFEGTTPWYELKKFKKKESDFAGKNYNYTYPYVYIDSQSGEVELINDSGTEAYCKVRLYGPLINPFWKLTQGDITITEGKVISVIDAKSCMVVNSDPRKLEIAEYDLFEQCIRDLYEWSDFSTGRFIYLPCGTSKLKVGHEGSGKIDFLVEVMEFAG